MSKREDANQHIQFLKANNMLDTETLEDWYLAVENEDALQAKLNEVRSLVEAWRSEAVRLSTYADDKVRIFYEGEYIAAADALLQCADELALALGDDVDSE